MKKFKNTFRIETARLAYWDYSNPGRYHITLNAKDHLEYFGMVKNGEMVLNELGIITDNFWKEIPMYFKNIELDHYIVMPNHIHGIIIINEHGGRDAINCVSTQIQIGGITGLKNPQLNPNSISNVIRHYKARCSFEIRKLNPNFSWQSRFYDRIIRNEKELYNVRKYIERNPERWGFKKNKPDLHRQR